MRRLKEISEIAGGQLSHSPDLPIAGAASIGRAVSQEITFVTSPKHLQSFLDSPAAAAIVCAGMGACEKPVIVSDAPEAAFAKVAALFRTPVVRPPATETRISDRATVSPSATIGNHVVIHPHAVVMDNVTIGDHSVVFPNVTIMENCTIGCNVQIFPNAVMYENTVVGDRSIIHAGCVLGCYGFGYKSDTGTHQLSAQLGNVVIESDVELGANTTVDRGTYDSTYVRQGSKLDNLVMVGHNCEIGKHNLLCSQVGIAGSCNTGDYVVMGGQVGVGDHLNIGDKAMISAKSGLMRDVEPGERMTGAPAKPSRVQMQLFSAIAKLPETRKEVRNLKRQVAELLQGQSAKIAPRDAA